MVHAVVDDCDENDRPPLEFEVEKVVRGFFRPDLFRDYSSYSVLFEQEDRGLPLISQCAGSDASDADYFGDGGEQPSKRRAGDVWQGGRARLAQGGRLLAHAGLGQEHLDALLGG